MALKLEFLLTSKVVGRYNRLILEIRNTIEDFVAVFMAPVGVGGGIVNSAKCGITKN